MMLEQRKHGGSQCLMRDGQTRQPAPCRRQTVNVHCLTSGGCAPVAAPDASDASTALWSGLQQQQQQQQQYQHLTALQLQLQLRQLHQSPSQPQVNLQQQQQQQLSTQLANNRSRSTAVDFTFTQQLKQCACWLQLLQLVIDCSDGLVQLHNGRQQQQKQQKQQKPQQWRQQQQQQQQQHALLVPPQAISRGLGQLNPRHLSCLLCLLVKLQPAATSSAATEHIKVFNQFTSLVFAEAFQQLRWMTPRELSNILWAAAKVPQPPAAQHVKQMFQQFASASAVADANPQDLSMALYAVAALGVQVSEVQLEAVLQAAVGQLSAAASQAVANTIWAVAVLQYRPDEWWLQAIEQRCCNLLQQRLARQREQEQVIMSGEAAPLAVEQPSAVHTHQRQPGISSKCLHQLLWSFARLQWLPTRQFQQLFWAVSAGQLAGMSPLGTTGILWAAATLQVQPPQPWMDAWYHTTSRQLRARLFNDQDAANALWSLVRLRQRPGSNWLGAAMAGSWAVLGGAGAQELSNMLWGWAKLGVAPAPAWVADWLRAMSRVMSSYCAPALASSVYALAVLRFKPPQIWCEALLCESQRQMAAFGAQELSNLIWALAVLQLHPGREWMQDFEMQAAAEAGSFNAQELSVVCWSLARLGHVPPPDWLAQLLGEGLEPHGGLALQSLTMLMWALVRWRLPEFRENGQYRMLLPRYWAAAEQLLPQASLTQLSLLLWARASLGCTPSSSWQQSFWIAAEPALHAASSSSQLAATQVHQGRLQQQQQQKQQKQQFSLLLPPSTAAAANPPITAMDSIWQVQAIVRLVWAAGKLSQQPPAATSRLLLEACTTALPNCSYGALVSLGLSLLRLHRGEQAALGRATAAAGGAALHGGTLQTSSTPARVLWSSTVQQAAPFWQDWFHQSERLLLQLQPESNKFQQQQQQSQHRQRQQQHANICLRDLSTQLNVVWQLRLQPPKSWCLAVGQALPSLSSTATFGQLSWLVCAVVKLRLEKLLPSGWAGQVLLMCLQSPDVKSTAGYNMMPGSAIQLNTRVTSTSSSSSSGSYCRDMIYVNSQAGSYRRLRRALRILHTAGYLTVQEWQLWLQLQNKLCDRMGLLC